MLRAASDEVNISRREQLRRESHSTIQSLQPDGFLTSDPSRWVDPAYSCKGRFQFGEDVLHTRMDVKLSVRVDRSAGSPAESEASKCLLVEVDFGGPRECRACLADERFDLLISAIELRTWRRLNHQHIQRCYASFNYESDLCKMSMHALDYNYSHCLTEIVASHVFHNGTLSSQSACVEVLSQLRGALSFLEANKVHYSDLSSNAVYVHRQSLTSSPVRIRCQIRNQLPFAGCAIRVSPGSGLKVKEALEALAKKQARRCSLQDTRLVQQSANLLRLACLGMQLVLGVPSDLCAQPACTYWQVLSRVDKGEYTRKFLNDLIEVSVAEIAVSQSQYSRLLKKFGYMIQSWNIEVKIQAKNLAKTKQ